MLKQHVKATNIKLTTAIADYVEKKINTLEKIISILIDNGFVDQLNAIDDDNSNLVIEIIIHMISINNKKKYNKKTYNKKTYNKFFSLIKKIKKEIDFEQPTADTILNITILNKDFKLAHYFIKNYLGINFSTADSPVISETRGDGFESSHRQLLWSNY